MPQPPVSYTTMTSASTFKECDISLTNEMPHKDSICILINTCPYGDNHSSVIHRSHRQENSDQRISSHSSHHLAFAQYSQSYLLSLSPTRPTFSCSEEQSIRSHTVGISASFQHSGHSCDRASPAYNCRYSTFHESSSPFIGQDCHPFCDSRSQYQVSESLYLCNNDLGSPYMSVDCDRSPASVQYQCNDSRYAELQYLYINGNICVQNDEDKPIDLSKKLESDPNVNSNDDYNSVEIQNNGSLLRNLLRHGSSGSTQISQRDGRDSSFVEKYKPETVSRTTRVTLAKKMLYPITSRVSEWLVKIVQFAKSIPEFCLLSQNDKITLIINSWTRLLLLLMAENEFEFAVTPLTQIEQRLYDTDPGQDEPTMKSVEGIQHFIRKCKNMSIDQTEYALIRMSVLFNSVYAGLDSPDIVEKLSTAKHQLLQQHVTSLHPAHSIHYSQILMLLPSLYGINCCVVEHLFCKQINTDIDVLLKETLQKL